MPPSRKQTSLEILRLVINLHISSGSLKIKDQPGSSKSKKHYFILVFKITCNISIEYYNSLSHCHTMSKLILKNTLY